MFEISSDQIVKTIGRFQFLYIYVDKKNQVFLKNTNTKL